MNSIRTIPDSYRGMDEAELDERIAGLKDKMGEDLCILGHYYQRDEVVKWADHQGDSFQLARFGSETPAKHIVFCGVHFMAEASAILAKPDQRVFMPTLEAGCPLADMADVDQLTSAWRALEDAGVVNDYVPVTYMNSSAAIKAFCGKAGGTVCTSSSAGKAFDWAEKQNKKVFFLPDENLSKNTALAKGFNPEEIGVWDPNALDYAKQAQQSKEARTIVWKGFCHVHTFFTTEHIANARSKYPGCIIAVHPECFPEVVSISDANGSTSFLKKYAEDAPAGSTVVIGTEISFVNRIAKENPDKKVLPLARSLCPNMFRTSLSDLLWVLEELGEVNEVRVPRSVILEAKKALDRMLAL